MIRPPTPVLLFISYASEDEPLFKALENHLSPLQKHGLIRIWQKRQITAGTDWSKEIDRQLEDASIILLLISADFFASNYCYGIEVERALQRHNAGKALLIPIFLRPVDWARAPFAHLQGLPSTGKAVTEWQVPDLAFREIAQSLRYIVEGPPNPKALENSPPLSPPLTKSSLPVKGFSRRTAVIGVVGFISVTLGSIGFSFYRPTSSASTPTAIVKKNPNPTSTPLVTTNSQPTATPLTITNPTPAISASAIKYSGKLTSETLNGQNAAMHLILTSLDQSNNTLTGTLTMEPPLTDRGGDVNGAIDSNGAISRFIVSSTISPALNFVVSKHLDSFYSGTYSGTTLDSKHNYLESGTWQMTRS